MREGPIVVAVDLSEASAYALREARDIALREDRRIILVHSFPDAPHAAGGAANVLEGEELPFIKAQGNLEKEEAEELTKVWAKSLRDRGLAVDIVAEREAPAALVLRVLQETEAALLVVGRRGLGRLQRFLLGSVSTELAQRSPVPVLVVPERG